MCVRATVTSFITRRRGGEGGTGAGAGGGGGGWGVDAGSDGHPLPSPARMSTARDLGMLI